MKFSCDDLYGQTEQAIGSLVRRELHRLCDRLAAECESPIEVMLGCGLDAAFRSDLGSFYRQHTFTAGGFSVDKMLGMIAGLDRLDQRMVVICPQLVVESYRLDFGVLYPVDRGRICGIAIECDGHDFHYGDRETVTRDRKRDRELQDLGFIVKRFPGADIHRDLEACVDDIWGTVFQACFDDSRSVPPKGVIAQCSEHDTSMVVFGRRMLDFDGEQIPRRDTE